MFHRQRFLIVGCGFLGQEIAKQIHKADGDVTCWSRSPMKDPGLPPWLAWRVAGDVADPAAWKDIDDNFDAVVHAASSGKGGVDAYRSVYLEGMIQIARKLPLARKVFVSSTSVYGQTDGEWVSEKSAAEPSTETGKILIEAEKIATEAGDVAVRLGGLYGGERGVLFQRLLRGEAVIEGNGTRWMNQIHRYDAAAAVVHLLAEPAPGEIFNVVDDTPTSHLDYFKWCCSATGLPIPPFGPVQTERKRGVTNKRVSNEKLRKTGWSPLFPSFREGLAKPVAAFKELSAE